MIRFFLTSTIISSIFLIGLIGVVVTFKLSQNVYAIQPGPLDDCKETASLWRHTYGHPDTVGLPHPITWSRFEEHTPACVVAKGTIENDPGVSDEHDGDYHFLLTPDKGYDDLLNQHNTKGLMVEIVCWAKNDIASSYTQEYGDYCNGVDTSGHYPSLKYGDHVEVIGKWVQDVGHGTAPHEPWNEIHPAVKVVILPKKSSFH